MKWVQITVSSCWANSASSLTHWLWIFAANITKEFRWESVHVTVLLMSHAWLFFTSKWSLHCSHWPRRASHSSLSYLSGLTYSLHFYCPNATAWMLVVLDMKFPIILHTSLDLKYIYFYLDMRCINPLFFLLQFLAHYLVIIYQYISSFHLLVLPFCFAHICNTYLISSVVKPYNVFLEKYVLSIWALWVLFSLFAILFIFL